MKVCLHHTSSSILYERCLRLALQGDHNCCTSEGVERTIIDILLTLLRWSRDFIPVSQSQPLPVMWRRSYWHCCSNRSLIHASRIARCYFSASFRSGCCVMLYQLGYYLHRPGLQWPRVFSPRRCTHERGYDGRCGWAGKLRSMYELHVRHKLTSYTLLR
jgi:hypothetical protein